MSAPQGYRRVPAWVGRILGAAGLLASGVALLDPARGSWAPWAALPALLGWAIAPRPRSGLAFVAALSAVWSTGVLVRPEFRADASSYFVQLRSLAFDHDLDFANEWEALGLRAPGPTATGRPASFHPIGPALLWSPFYAAAHVYVALGPALGGAPFEADGLSPPYRRAAALGTGALVLAGSVLVWLTLARERGFDRRTATLAAAATVLASPILYYTLVVPGMAHGPTFALAATLLFAWHRAERGPSANAWLGLGAAFGGLLLVRWQAAVYGLLLAPLALVQLRQRRARWSWLLLAGAAALLVFLPQMLVWRVLFGSALTVPQGPGFLGNAGRHSLDVLLSADHGLLTWTPAVALGLVGLAAGVRRAPLFHGAALAVVAATTWVNGSVPPWDWAAGDAFGARRFDSIVPLVGAGLAVAVRGITALIRRRPFLVPASLMAFLVAWNLGLVSQFRRDAYPNTAPLDRVARQQVLSLRRLLSSVAGGIAGARGRAFVYRTFSGEYLYRSFARDGTILLADADERFQLEGWATRASRSPETRFRWAFHPEACLTLPLEAPFDLRLEITAKAPKPARPQTMSVHMNDTFLARFEVAAEWTPYPVTAPTSSLVAGENRLCLRFTKAAPGDEGTGLVAAGVSRVQLP